MRIVIEEEIKRWTGTASKFGICPFGSDSGKTVEINRKASRHFRPAPSEIEALVPEDLSAAWRTPRLRPRKARRTSREQ